MMVDLILFVIAPCVLLTLGVRYFPMPIRDRYILSKYATLFFIAFALQVALILLVRLGDKELGTIFDDSRPIMESVMIFLYNAPRRILEVVPAAGIMGSFFAIGSLTRSNELTALRATGTNIYRMVMPIFLFTFGVCLITLCFVDRIVAPATAEAKRLERDQAYEADREIVFREASGALVFIQHLDLPRKTARNVTFYEMNGGRLEREVFAPQATWDESLWVLKQGWTRRFDGVGVQYERFGSLNRRLDADPRILVATANDPATMTFTELTRVMEFKRRAGQSVRKEVVQYQHS
ncbi:MAG: LptF/LptG family permease, partial [Candidatus Poribacteria bacterium]|nr:LptF/LptG family permease [Candidatus Poribacteria bacterium]